MIKQTLFFASPVRLSLRYNQLIIRKKDCDEIVSRPIEDIGCVVLENQMISATLPLLNELVKNNVAVVLCDAKMMPSSMLAPLEANTTQAESFKHQLSATEPMRKQAWKQVVEAKIANQAALLAKLGKECAGIKALAANVKSGDTDNREGAAARIYWSQLFGDGFRRDRYGDAPNDMLNYGYTILRAAVARALLGSGLMPAFGIFHRNRYNAFPLADDLMDPYRPYVDEIVHDQFTNGCSGITQDFKLDVMRVLTCDVEIGNVVRPLQIALTFTSASLCKYFAGKVKRLSLPIYK